MEPQLVRLSKTVTIFVTFFGLIKTLSAACLPNSTQFESSCYSFLNITTWANGQKWCQEIGTMHMVIESAEENAFIIQEMRLRDMAHAWIGCSDEQTEGAWVCHFADGVTRAMSYADWRSDQPNNWKNQDCASVRSDNGKWMDDFCHHHERFYVVCETNSTKVEIPPAVVSSSAGTVTCYIMGADGRLRP
ncbi:lectin BRA-3-like [Patiria miniata]|uniref:C-type lectin domain-containing protein n=1 Tax=Patiria miniata TaxID=46514 RepID=A0A914ACI6_PATMI|nr:lectin BRA-3-like [Patiria miniata]